MQRSSAASARRLLVPVFLVAAFTIASVAVEAGSVRRQPAPPPNVLLIVTDDMDAKLLAEMPAVEALVAAQGVRFGNAFATTPLCCPARVSLLRGQYVHNHGVLRNTGEQGGFPYFRSSGAEASTLATWLQSGGYRSGLFGKYLNGYPKRVPDRYQPPGWDEWSGAIDQSAYGNFDYALNQNGEVVRYGSAPEEYLTDVLGRRAGRFIEQSVADGQPFFAYVATYAPHWPAVPAPRHAGLYGDARAPRGPAFAEADVADKPAWVRGLPPVDAAAEADIDERYRERLRSLAAVDEMVAGLVETLDRTGALDNTYVVFTSDNGFHLGEHRLRYGKQTPYDEAIRVPLLIRGPRIPAGVERDALALGIDLAPTIADWAGVAPPAYVDGRSLVPLLEGPEGNGEEWRRSFLVELYGTGRGDSAGGESAATPGADPDQESDRPVTPPYSALRSVDLLYVEYETGERELYDLVGDPFQLENFASRADPTLLAELAVQLDALRSCAGDGCRSAEDAPTPAIDDGRATPIAD